MTVLVALILGVSALLSSEATGDWHEALRQQIKRSAMSLENIRHVYADEAPEALWVAISEARAAELRLGADPLARSEAAVETQVAWHLRTAHHGDETLLDGDRYRSPGGFEVPQRLAAIERENPAPDPEAARGAGDRAADLASLIGMLTVPIVLVYLLGQAVLLARRRTLRRRAQRQERKRDVGLIPEPERQRRFALTLGVSVWVTMTLLAPAYAYAQIEEQRALISAATQADRVAASIAGSSLAFAFRLAGDREALHLQLRAAGREYTALDVAEHATGQHEIAVADEAAAGVVKKIAAHMSRPPVPGDGVSDTTLDYLTATPDDWDARLAEQVAQAELADEAGKWGNLLGLVILFAAFAAALVALAEVTDPAQQAAAIRKTALGLLAGAALLIAYGLIG
ncbi:hypothetical protein HCN51_21605 [Nonomuraea sp. FMUSA5-5]|uniref:Uncharacterized protein n=1 Tax=Nonomuraea composti TaxID=2720023 RepID=A0ABX1B2G4_9ACTN|nr:hypothetical protein [Nonomuraea sp. FMUSA5-5]NJP92025.1 hypothetical protein [Nonomuraea sp. FMUSA5-5]